MGSPAYSVSTPIRFTVWCNEVVWLHGHICSGSKREFSLGYALSEHVTKYAVELASVICLGSTYIGVRSRASSSFSFNRLTHRLVFVYSMKKRRFAPCTEERCQRTTNYCFNFQRARVPSLCSAVTLSIPFVLSKSSASAHGQQEKEARGGLSSVMIALTPPIIIIVQLER